MGIIPHPSIPIGDVRPNDICLLLVLGVMYELITRVISIIIKTKSKKEKSDLLLLKQLRLETNKKRSLGPSAFVETSKLERQVLSKEKEIAKIAKKRDLQIEKFNKINKNLSFVLYVIIFILYYGVPIFNINGMDIPVDNLDDMSLGNSSLESSNNRAKIFFKSILFPISYMGVGIKFAHYGIPNAASAMGALVPLWSSQVTIGKLFDCIEIFF